MDTHNSSCECVLTVRGRRVPKSQETGTYKLAHGQPHPMPAQATAPARLPEMQIPSGTPEGEGCSPHYSVQRGNSRQRPGHPKGSGPTAPTRGLMSETQDTSWKNRGQLQLGVWGLYGRHVRTTLPPATSILSVPQMKWVQLVSRSPSTARTLVKLG